MDSSSLNSVIFNELTNWYWKYGSKRSGNYQLPRSGFLSPLYELAERLESIPEPSQSERAVIGLWGPSQVGKSTLLSSFLDLGADGMGHGSILQWSESEPIRFERSMAHPDERPLSLNPYNFKADASACISRFVLMPDVPDPNFPVEIKLAETSQILHALALGYLNDWNQEDGNSPRRAETVLESQISSNSANRSINKNGFNLAHAAAVTLRLLQSSKLEHQRYQTLSEDHIDRFLDSPVAVASREKVEESISEIFWDGENEISSLSSEVLKTINFYKDSCRRIYCSYEVASLLVDMQSHLNAQGGTTIDGDPIPEDDELSKRILRIGRISDNAGNIYLGVGHGDAAFEELVDYAVFQAAVWELRIPINSHKLGSLAADGSGDAVCFQQLLKQVDVLDFPGVSNIGKGGGDRINTSVINKRGHHLLFSHLVKRGKTSAMVAASANRSHVDGFCLLMRAQGALANPGIINDGIQTWKSSCKVHGEPFVNVVVTFFSELIQDAIRNPEKTSFKGAFNSLEALSGELFEGDNVFPICFHKYEGLIPDGFWKSGEINQEIEMLISNVEGAAGRLSSDPDYARLFGSHTNNVTDSALVEEGGVKKVVDRLIAQGSRVAKKRYYENLRQEIEKSMRRLLEMALPGETSELERKKHLLEKISTGIWSKIQPNDNSYSPTKAQEISAGLRSLLTIHEADLDAVPMRVAKDHSAGRHYVKKQLEKWCERGTQTHAALGIRNPSDAANLCSYLAAAVQLEEAFNWLVKNFGTITRPAATQDACRYLSVKLTELLMPRNQGDTEPQLSPEDLIQKIGKAEYAQQISPQECPHYLGVIMPFMARLKDVSGRAVGERPPQEGDKELLEIIEPETKKELSS